LVHGVLGCLCANTYANSDLLDMSPEEFSKIQKRHVEREEKEKKKHDREIRKKDERDKKKFSKWNRRDNKIDRATERLGVGLSHSATDKHILLFRPTEVAMQIVLQDSELFSAIPPFEFLHQSWNKGKGPHITEFITHFNNLCHWTTTWIVKQTDIKIRVITLQHILDIANELFQLGDFNALFAIGSAISSAPVSRLKNTFQMLDGQRRQVVVALEQLTDNTNNYRHYKHLRETHILTTGRCVPQLAIYLGQLTFMEDGNPTFRNDSDIINMDKCRLVTRTVDEIRKMQSYGYQGVFDNNQEVRNLILHTPRIDNSDEQYEYSLQCEASKRFASSNRVDLKARQKFHSLPLGVSIVMDAEKGTAVAVPVTEISACGSAPVSLDDSGISPRAALARRTPPALL